MPTQKTIWTILAVAETVAAVITWVTYARSGGLVRMIGSLFGLPLMHGVFAFLVALGIGTLAALHWGALRRLIRPRLAVNVLRDLGPLALKAYEIRRGLEQAGGQLEDGGWARYDLLIEELRQRGEPIGLHIRTRPDWLREFAIRAKRGDLKGARRMAVRKPDDE